MNHLYEYLEFGELDTKSQKKAIENVRDRMYSGDYGGGDLEQNAIDDDALFEPPDSEMEGLFGEGYYEANGDRFMIGNDREGISYVGKQDPNYYIKCKDALDVTNDNLFLRWLGIPSYFWPYTYYSFVDPNRGSTRIEFEIDDIESMFEHFGEESEDSINSYFEKAEKKFDNHLESVLSKISSYVDDQFEDNSIIDTIESYDVKFENDGSISDD